ncbi:hypothetical protein ID866_4808 [Astraeus odoratus]|nr:hypothetical protein ID866_4808 [Astraeus odoratus]
MRSLSTMFNSAATKIAHSSTIPALASATSSSELRQLQDLITAEKSVLLSLQKLSTDLAKASEALRAWGEGEGDDLSDVLMASATVLSHFSGALTTWASLHNTVRDSMKAVRSREEALDERKRRKKRMDASAEAVEKKIHKMSLEHKDIDTQTDTLKKLREEIRAMDEEIMREEAALTDFKRKCTKNWMTLKFGGLAECCEKGFIVADMGKCIVKEIPEDVTLAGLPRAPFTARGRVSGYINETQQAILQVKFSDAPSGRKSLAPTGATPGVGDAQNQLAPPWFVHSHVTPYYIPAPPIGGNTLGGNGPPPSQRRRSTTINEFGVHRFGPRSAPPFSTNPFRGREPAPVADILAPPSRSTIGNGASGEEQSLMASISGAFARTHGAASVEQTSIGDGSIDPVPKYEAVVASEWHGYSASRASTVPVPGQQKRTARASTMRVPGQQQRAARQNTSPPVPPPGAAPTAIRAWENGSGQGEDSARSDHPTSSIGLAYDKGIPSSAAERTMNSNTNRSKVVHESSVMDSHERAVNMPSSVEGTPLEPPSGAQTPGMSVPYTQPLDSGLALPYDVTTYSISSITLTPHSRGESQRCTPSTIDPEPVDMRQSSQPVQHPHTPESPSNIGEHISKMEASAEHVCNATAAAQEISRELDALSSSVPADARAPFPHSSVNPQPPLQEHPSATGPLISSVALATPSVPSARQSVSPTRQLTSSLERPPPRYSDDQTPPPFASTPPSPLRVELQAELPDAGDGASAGQRSLLNCTPPENPRSAPSLPSLPMAGFMGAGAPRTIAAAAFRWQQQHGGSPSASGIGDPSSAGPADMSPHAVSDDFDYIAASGGWSSGEQAKSGQGDGHSRNESMGMQMSST